MSSKKSKTEPNYDVTLETLESAPNRALAFLRALGTSRAIRAAMFARGYSADDHREGWKPSRPELLLFASGEPVPQIARRRCPRSIS